ncbi:hypothetical protein CHELA1G11_10989 [Hyphomicrobiales bacterium]|nr:hypothetical protein CHELA1G11_10989 [Hyphomicrobiales bacterium]
MHRGSLRKRLAQAPAPPPFFDRNLPLWKDVGGAFLSRLKAPQTSAMLPHFPYGGLNLIRGWRAVDEGHCGSGGICAGAEESAPPLSGHPRAIGL